MQLVDLTAVLLTPRLVHTLTLLIYDYTVIHYQCSCYCCLNGHYCIIACATHIFLYFVEFFCLAASKIPNSNALAWVVGCRPAREFILGAIICSLFSYCRLVGLRLLSFAFSYNELCLVISAFTVCKCRKSAQLVAIYLALKSRAIY